MTGFGYDATHSIVKAKSSTALRHVLYKPFRVDQLLMALDKNATPNGKGNGGR